MTESHDSSVKMVVKLAKIHEGKINIYTVHNWNFLDKNLQNDMGFLVLGRVVKEKMVE